MFLLFSFHVLMFLLFYFYFLMFLLLSFHVFVRSNFVCLFDSYIKGITFYCHPKKEYYIILCFDILLYCSPVAQASSMFSF